MKQRIDQSTWERKEHYAFFSKFDEPIYGVTVPVDCTKAYQTAKEKGVSFFMYYLYRALQAFNAIENFRLRIYEGEVYLYDVTHASTTVLREDKTFGFTYIDYHPDEQVFLEGALSEIARVKANSGLELRDVEPNMVQCSALPWLDFTGLSHARSFSRVDSCPKISFGKLVDEAGAKRMNISIHVHHGLVDGYHIGLFVEKFQQLLDEAA